LFTNTATPLIYTLSLHDALPIYKTAPMVTSNRLVIHANQVKDTINRNIYGQFSEHLGRCIYEGVWVGEGSPIPNTRGIRNDVVRSEEHTSELQSRFDLVCRLLLE